MNRGCEDPRAPRGPAQALRDGCAAEGELLAWTIGRTEGKVAGRPVAA